ncbi:uncharacterized protein DSM5745_05809 [Aspergillus mulundensis]|uniref:Uncharacterized protein n=1 Tax=Aspergillus mulundensis TaxID=1810919 RepID=A0A3D8RY18_9EURO|nr:hypothetical protein DSM5745_05809 [Aspergillus mulundensis]RDW78957.1 hypothetical protein DSM5745_05809 [Aspergillus mulundensis]
MLSARSSVFEAASRTREENPWLQSFQYYVDKLRQVQTTYKVSLNGDPPDLGHARHIWLLWDYDRIWGMFHFGASMGVMLVDPGPTLPVSDDEPGRRLPFAWRAVDACYPHKVHSDPERNKGMIVIDVLEGTLEGYFDFMNGRGDGGVEGRCGFRARQHRGPSVVPYSLEDVVRDWNRYGRGVAEEEMIRQELDEDELEEYERRREGRPSLKRKRDDDEDDGTSGEWNDGESDQEGTGREEYGEENEGFEAESDDPDDGESDQEETEREEYGEKNEGLESGSDDRDEDESDQEETGSDGDRDSQDDEAASGDWESD